MVVFFKVFTGGYLLVACECIGLGWFLKLG